MGTLDRFRVDGKVAVVTGAGRGIGAGCALALAEAGADVCVVSRSAESLEDVAAGVRALGRRAVVLAGRRERQRARPRRSPSRSSTSSAASTSW